MKINRIALAILVAAPLSMTVSAETTGLGITMTPMIGTQGFNRKSDEPNALGFRPKQDVLGSFALGYELTPSLAVEAQYTGTSNDVTQAGITTKGTSRSMEGNFLLNSDFVTGDYASRLKPYVLLGAGQQRLNYTGVGASTDTIVNLGLGAFYRVNPSVALRVEGRAVENCDNALTDFKALTGLQFTLGGHKRPFVAAPASVEVPPEPVAMQAPEPVAMQAPEPVVMQAPEPVVMQAPEPVVMPAPVVTPVTVEVTEDLKLSLRVFFDTNKSLIKKQYQPEIVKVAEKLKEFPNATAEIKGYTDSQGSSKLNDALSQARAEAVKSSLTTDYGIDANRLTAKGYSSDAPVASNTTVEGRALNRRVEAEFSGSRAVGQ